MKNLIETKRKPVISVIRKSIMSLLIALPLFSISQSITPANLNGSWEGILKQVENNYTNNYAYWMSFDMRGDSVFGYVRTEAVNTPYYAVITLRGKVTGNTIKFVQEKIIKQSPRPESGWCLIKGDLVFNGNNFSLSGNWTSDMEKCNPGSLFVYKTQRPINMGPTVVTVYSTFPNVYTLVKSKKSVSGYKVVLSKVHFLTNSHEIETNSAAEEVDAIFDLLNKYQVLHVHIQGHTDNVGDDDFNMTLSYLRAKEIYNLLIAKGVKESRITYEGYGKSRPIATNETEEGKLKNRRVEIELDMFDAKAVKASK